MDGKAMCETVQENGRNPDIESAFSRGAGITLATEPCQEKSNGIKAMSLLIGRLDIARHAMTADAMAMQKDIVDEIRKNFLQDSIKCRYTQAAMNLDTIQRIVHAVSSIWRGRRRKLADKARGIAELNRHISFGFTRLMRFMGQK